MPTLVDTRRFLSDFDSTRTGNVLTDVLVIGSGVAGARAAIEASAYGSVILLTKGRFEDSATAWAQGGIAAAVGAGDSPARHLEDTLRVGCGLSDRRAVEILVEEGPRRVEELLSWGFPVDRADGTYELGREGGHSLNRVVHASGDRTGWELARTLHEHLRRTEHVRLFEQCYVIDLLTIEGRCVGAVTFHQKYGHQLIWAGQTILASGGCGQLWRETTNPPSSTGDGLAAAFRAGATLRDMELMQFHPTTLYVAGAARALISEAVRGEGAQLVDRGGHRFMTAYHPDAELAPRDVVSRAIHQRLLDTGSNCVYLDVRQVRDFTHRFPQITRLCADFQIDVTNDLIPVRPSAHYMIGGVLVDLDGRTSLPGLYCCGESASTGIHGANRMASNSLLEGLVFGRRAGEKAGKSLAGVANGAAVKRVSSRNQRSTRTPLDLGDITNSLRSVMWRNVGIIRRRDRLVETAEILDFWAHYTLDKTFDEVSGWETQNRLTVARLIAAGALEREESTGVHYREDAPDVAAKPCHILVTRSDEGTKPTRA